jgi:hypothetical protein
LRTVHPPRVTHDTERAEGGVERRGAVVTEEVPQLVADDADAADTRPGGAPEGWVDVVLSHPDAVVEARLEERPLVAPDAICHDGVQVIHQRRVAVRPLDSGVAGLEVWSSSRSITGSSRGSRPTRGRTNARRSAGVVEGVPRLEQHARERTDARRPRQLRLIKSDTVMVAEVEPRN